MKIYVVGAFIALSMTWCVINADDVSQPVPAVTVDEPVAEVAHQTGVATDIDDLVKNYKKYEFLATEFAALRVGQVSKLGRFLKYMSIPASLGSFWLVINLLVNDNYEGVLKLDLPREQAWFISWFVATLVFLFFLYTGDSYIDACDYARARAALVEFVRDWEGMASQIPEELHPLFKLLHQFYQVDGTINLDDRLLLELMHEIIKKHKKASYEIRAKIAAHDVRTK